MIWISSPNLTIRITATAQPPRDTLPFRSDRRRDGPAIRSHKGPRTSALGVEVHLPAGTPAHMILSIAEEDRPAPNPASAREEKSHRQLAKFAPRLLADARHACMREGVTPTREELHRRIGRRLDLEPSRVEDVLDRGRLTPADPAAQPERARALADEILGERERTVFLARCAVEGNMVTPVAALAATLGVTADQIQRLEASARRKIAVALAGSDPEKRDGEARRTWYHLDCRWSVPIGSEQESDERATYAPPEPGGDGFGHGSSPSRSLAFA